MHKGVAEPLVRDPDHGFSIVEILVAVFLFGLIVIVFLPLLVNSIRMTTTNATTATAVQIVSDQLERARAAGPSCEALTGFKLGTIDPVTDSHGAVLQATRSVGTCPTTYPGTVSVTIAVKKSGTATPIAESTALIYVKSAASG
jgi:type II secretory pathway pseudopilin PulG